MIKLVLGFFFFTFFVYAHASNPWWGIQVQPMNRDMLESCGLQGDKGTIVVFVDEGSPAKNLIRQGDVILEVNHKKIGFPQDLAADQPSNPKSIQVKLWRKNKEIKGRFVPQRNQPTKNNIDDKILGNVEINAMPDGIVVAKVNRQGLLQTGDILLEINNRKIQNIADVFDALKANNQSLSIALDRKGARIVQSFAINDQGSFFSQTIISSN